MNSDLIKIDTKLVFEFDTAVSDVDVVFSEISGKLESVRDTISQVADEMRIRAFFHERWGVEKVKVSLSKAPFSPEIFYCFFFLQLSCGKFLQLSSIPILSQNNLRRLDNSQVQTEQKASFTMPLKLTYLRHNLEL